MSWGRPLIFAHLGPQKAVPSWSTVSDIQIRSLEQRLSIEHTPRAMAEKNIVNREEIDQFILDEIDSVPHLEALLLLWNSRPKAWPLQEMAKALYISADHTQTILQDLKQRTLAAMDSEGKCYSYDPASGRDKLIEDLDRIYRHDLVRISTMIHSKAPASVREFARAFKLKKD